MVNPRLPRMLYPSFITQSWAVCKGKPSVQTLQLFLTISDSSLRMLKDGQNCFGVLQKKNEALQILSFVTLMKQYLECFSWFNYAQFLERPLNSNSQLAQAENAGVTFSFKICRDLQLKIQSGFQFLSVKVVMNIHDDCMMIVRFRNLKWKIKNR